MLRYPILCLALAAGLGGCVVAERPPSAALPCDPALIGDWGLAEGRLILGNAPPPPPKASDFAADDERRLRIGADCRARLPAKPGREAALRVYAADGRRYLGLGVEQVQALIQDDAPPGDAERDFARRHPDAVALLRYRADAVSLRIEAPDPQIAEALFPSAGPAPNLIRGDREAVRAALRRHPQLFERPDAGTVYRFIRLTPFAPAAPSP